MPLVLAVALEASVVAAILAAADQPALFYHGVITRAQYCSNQNTL
jgi:hypothetical protein